MEKRGRRSARSVAPMPTTLTHAPVYVDDLDRSAAFYTAHLGLEVRDDVTFDPSFRWLTLAAPGAGGAELLLAAIDHHIPEPDRRAMREIVAKGALTVFLEVEDVDAVFERLRAGGAEVLQEPETSPERGARDCGVRDPSGNHLRISSPLPG